jgi:hypothetical protein
MVHNPLRQVVSQKEMTYQIPRKVFDDGKDIDILIKKG